MEQGLDERLKERIHGMFYPKTIAVLGASRDPAKWGHRVVSNIRLGGFLGECIPVNPEGGEIAGLAAVRSLDEISSKIDLALIVVAPEKVVDSIEACIEKGVKSIFVITAGFSEAGEEGIAVEKEMARLALDSRIPLSGPNGQGITCTQGFLCAQMYPIMPPEGHISIITASGNIGVTMANLALHHNVGISKVMSAGNEAMLTTAHYLDYLTDDPDTNVIAVYLEGARDGRMLMDSLQKAVKVKPVIVLKAGSSLLGSRAASSHTGALSGADRIYEGMLSQTGAIRVETMDELFETAATFDCQPLPKGRRTAVVTVGGGWGVLAADAASRYGLDLPELPEEIRTSLDRMLPRRWSRANPIDFAAGEGPEVQVHTLDLLMRSDRFDAVVLLGVGHTSLAAHLIMSSRLGSDPAAVRRAQVMMAHDLNKTRKTLALAHLYPKPLIMASDAVVSSRSANPALALMREERKHVLASPDSAMRVLGHLCTYASGRDRA